MAYDATKPLDDGYLADAPAELRELHRALKEDKIVNAGMLNGYTQGNGSGKIPLNNGTLNTNLNADLLDGHDSAYFSASTHGHDGATTSAAGFMTTTQVTKLNGIATGAEVNQNAFSNVTVGSSTIQADGKTDTLTLAAGNYISLSADTANDKVTIGVSWPTVTADGYRDIISLYDADATSNRCGTIRVSNGNGYHEILIGVHNESNGAPNGISVRNTNGTIAATVGGALTVNNNLTVSGSITVSGGVTANNFNGYTLDLNTNNTTDSWVPVLTGTKFQHRVIPANAKFTDTVTTASISGSGNAVTSVTASDGALTVKKDSTFSLSSHTHNYAGSSSAGGAANSLLNFTSGLNGVAEHNANNITTNGLWYYTSNGPATSLGASVDDGALYSQAYSANWVAQIAQDYRNGNLFVRGRNNGTWKGWQAVLTNNSSLNAAKLTGTVPSGCYTNTVYTHPTTAGNKHIPAGGSSGQILRWSAAGTAAWGAENNTTYTAGNGMELSGTKFRHKLAYAWGSTAAATATKVATVSIGTFELTAGALCVVYLTKGNTYMADGNGANNTGITFNLSSTGAKDVVGPVKTFTLLYYDGTKFESLGAWA